MDIVRIGLGQINSTVGDLKGNSEKMMQYINYAIGKGVDIIIFPELSITGYPPEDLLLKKYFIDENIVYLERIISNVGNIIVVLGFADKDDKGVYNSAAIIYNRKLVYTYHKIHLPNYGVFDEKRYFKAGEENALIKTRDFCFGVNICEDIWVQEDMITRDIFKNSQFIINISASPYHMGKMRERIEILRSKVKSFKIPVVYCNLVGGQDELIFDGRSCIIMQDGRLGLEANPFKEELIIFDLPLSKKKAKKVTRTILLPYSLKKKVDKVKTMPHKKVGRYEEVYNALVLGVSDYVYKNGFQKVALGLSGGIDSSLVACIAVDAVGMDNVLGLSMPSRYSSVETQEDVEILARNLGIRCIKIPIEPIFDAYLKTLELHFQGRSPDITEENIQARIRGNILMAFSNKFGYLILSTGNKSEISVGYCTLYGDMVGGFAVIKDIPKRLVYKLGKYKNKNAGRDIIPQRIFERPPSAELRPNQKDEDTIPPYYIIDKVIDLYIEQNLSFRDIVKRIKDEDNVRRVLEMIDINEYKRRQAAPGIKITPRAFGKDRRMPITNKFKEVFYGGNDK